MRICLIETGTVHLRQADVLSQQRRATGQLRPLTTDQMRLIVELTDLREKAAKLLFDSK